MFHASEEVDADDQDPVAITSQHIVDSLRAQRERELFPLLSPWRRGLLALNQRYRGVTGRFQDAYAVLRGRAEIEIDDDDDWTPCRDMAAPPLPVKNTIQTGDW